MGTEGTEAAFKSLSGQGQRLIHIATHGFFYNETDSTFARFNLGDNPMVRSGLFLAGADNKWYGDGIPHGVEDGFLTSLEISNLDFRGLDMVVLSACETGKGNIKGDGVFGLQRGFKMASANSILMSLWKVNDEATCLLMSEFYKHWIGECRSKHDALEMAKQTLRSHKEKHWDNPEFWAAFILLDGLD
jgi:CHAT domain-containing protein